MASAARDRTAGGRLAAAPRRLWAFAAAGVATFWRNLTLQEVSGSLGDLGTFLPLLVGLVKTSGLNLSTTLIFSGIYNIITGVAFGIPMPVQPMKTIAAVALSQAALTVPQIMAAGIFVSACVMALGALRAFWLASKLIPQPVIRGMQLGLGLELARKGWQQAWYANSKSAPTRQWWGAEGLFLSLFALAFILLTVYPREDETGAESQPGVCGTAAAETAAAETAAAAAAAGTASAAKEAAAAEAGAAGKDEAAPDLDASSEAGSSRSSDAGSSGSRPLLRLKHNLERIGERTEQSLTGVKSSCGSGASGARVEASSGSGGSTGLALSGRQRGFQLPAALLLVVLGVVLTLAYYPDVARALSFGPSAIQALVPSAEDWRIGILQAGLPQLALTSFNSVISVCQLAGELFPDRPASPDHVAFSVGAMNMVGCWFGAMPSCHGAGGLAAQARFGARTGAAPIFLGLVKLSLGLLFGSSLLTLLKSFPSPLLGAMLVFAGIQLAACGANQRGERGVAVLLLTAVVTLGMGNVALGVVAGELAVVLFLNIYRG